MRLALLALVACAPDVARGPVAFADQEAPVRMLEVEGGAEVAVTLGVLAGSAYDPPGREGLGGLVTRAVALGVPSGVEVRTHVGREAVTLSLVCPEGAAEPCLEAVAALVAPPDPARVPGAVTGALAAMEAPVDDVLLDDLVHRALYVAHPYGPAPGGRRATLTTLPPALVEAHHRRLWVRSNLAVVTAGVDEAGRGRIRTALEGVPAGPPPDLPLQAGGTEGPTLVVLDAPDRPLRMAVGLPVRGDPDDLPLALAALERSLGARVRLVSPDGGAHLPTSGVPGRLQHATVYLEPDATVDDLRTTVRRLCTADVPLEPEDVEEGLELLTASRALAARTPSLRAEQAVLDALLHRAAPTDAHRDPAALTELLVRSLSTEGLVIALSGEGAAAMRETIEDPGGTIVDGCTPPPATFASVAVLTREELQR
ncbi:MAG: insulinase family protein [Alphaproteobacteria bacterium]|nr:insulinase family protein [Alphaproteobacteria bacterium]MCB9690715.1 insulinase family protein [Alphaproteobacteria bacterium]MCB9695003.1 insulinase family protein [Alphaproteobacteria bacterium]